MRPILRAAPALAALLALPLAAACDGTSGRGGTGGNRLTPADVAGSYRVCTLAFSPSNTAFPVADLLERVIDPAPASGRPPPSLAMAPNGTYDLVYTRRSDGFLQQLRGSVTYGTSTVGLTVASTNTAGVAITDELLLPRPITLAFQPSPHVLSTDGSGVYAVPRADYARAAGISEEGLQPQISGRLTATLATGECP